MRRSWLLCWYWSLLALLVSANGEMGFRATPRSVNEDKREAGRAALHTIQDRSRTSACWLRATADIGLMCAKMLDEERCRFAVRLTQCHMERSARAPVRGCQEGETVEQCTKDMDSEAFSVYTMFYIQSESICYFLQEG
ncbi:hypothetical protein Pelo_12448 [Pelomyxa schiedti]|nr:hypothetical protein Pelo_12448 [Pelomyxa schiedti]